MALVILNKQAEQPLRPETGGVFLFTGVAMRQAFGSKKKGRAGRHPSRAPKGA